jgi:ubiquinol oxidase
MTDKFEFKHTKPKTMVDRIAFRTVKLMRIPADLFFAKRYGHRAIVLETVAAVPGMVGGMLLHLKSLRLMKPDEGWIRTLLEEAENERLHLMAFVELEQPTLFERLIVLLAQGIFFNLYFVAYLINQKLCHRMVGYLEEEACVSYTEFLKMIDEGNYPNKEIPEWTKEYWGLGSDAKLRELVIAIREDEAEHRDVNHDFAEQLNT